jgi:hypothetical protein
MRLFSATFMRLASASTLLVAAMVFIASPAHAAKPVNAYDNAHKSYVCKYIGKPAVDERLQTGQNPIWVDNHSLTGKDATDVKVGDTFSDGQIKSVVIVANTAKLNPEPTINDCPAPESPATPLTPPVVGRGGEVLGAATVSPVTPMLANTGVSALAASLLSMVILATTIVTVNYRTKKDA